MQNDKHANANLKKPEDANPVAVIPACAMPENEMPEKTLRAIIDDESGTTTLEWLLLLGAIALPSIYILTMALGAVVDYYRMMTTLNSLPFP